MTRVRKIDVGSQIGAGLSGYVAELASAMLGAELGLPVKLVGLGEGIDDLVPFDADEFVDALFE